MEERPPILTGTSLREYFKDMIGTAIAHQKVRVAETTEFYLVNLLAEFLETHNLFRHEGDGGSLDEEPLAFILKRAQEQQGFERVRELKRLGDTSLYVSGYFGDSLDGKLVDVDYYVAMGGRAYSALSEIFQGDSVAQLYEELSAKFLRLVDLLSEVSERTAGRTNQGLVRLYERYVKTGSERLARLLGEQGVLAIPGKGGRDPGFVQ
ncbi:MAG TPA: hypothetical protein VMB50_05805 [Myxococcales bacterium]|jgi:hypothetical protein|nr:hypothetical protein [Myxococcales bacterium]